MSKILTYKISLKVNSLQCRAMLTTDSHCDGSYMYFPHYSKPTFNGNHHYIIHLTTSMAAFLKNRVTSSHSIWQNIFKTTLSAQKLQK